MEDQTTEIKKTTTESVIEGPIEETPKDSSVGGMSVRALIAFTLVLTVCFITIAYAIIDIVVSIGTKTLPTFNVPEPLYSGFMVAIGAYLGKATAQKARS